MGAGAFIMAEILGIPYTEIAIAAIIPTILFYFANYIHCDLHAVKFGLLGIPRDELPRMRQMMRKLGEIKILIKAIDDLHRMAHVTLIRAVERRIEGLRRQLTQRQRCL